MTTHQEAKQVTGPSNQPTLHVDQNVLAWLAEHAPCTITVTHPLVKSAMWRLESTGTEWLEKSGNTLIEATGRLIQAAYIRHGDDEFFKVYAVASGVSKPDKVLRWVSDFITVVEDVLPWNMESIESVEVHRG